MATVVENDEGRRLEMSRWGLILVWAGDPGIGARMINARFEKFSFEKAFKQRRCLVLMYGFYEWRKENGGKQPHYIRTKSGRPFAFAGLWESWSRNGEIIQSCTTLTTGVNDFLQEIHHRMPVILTPEVYDLWLGPEVRAPDQCNNELGYIERAARTRDAVYSRRL